MKISFGRFRGSFSRHPRPQQTWLYLASARRTRGRAAEGVFGLEPLEWQDRMEVVRRPGGFKQESTSETKITPEAEAGIASLSEGYPHFIQQLAYSASEKDSDGNIMIDDVMDGASSGGVDAAQPAQRVSQTDEQKS
jgi:hypothetical protein